ncbi:MAG TPA: type I-E CRISPR-associated protein Cas7/Cse4/CasC [Deltaproteobacteria bacterium]|nr:type I-E CRISPR-associated protein Cas7/Cse4/CasC [Deltaproteobacteria bacterium]
MLPRFVQIHTLTSYPGVLLNRDDAGFAKRLPFGGVVRTRISSQCLKRHWRTYDGESSLEALDVPASVRSRYTFQQQIVDPLVEEGLDADQVRAATARLMKEVLGESAKAKKTKKDGEETAVLKTGQITVLGAPEIRYLREEVKGALGEVSSEKEAEDAITKRVKDKDFRKNLKALRHAAGLSAALFGRMVTSDLLARGDAAIHVAHAFTVHAQESESDYFSAVDELLEGSDELGSGHIGNVELTSGLYYGYVVVDLALLVSNLTGCEPDAWEGADRTLAAAVLERLSQIVATVSPGAKLGSTAPYAYAQALMVEVGRHQPRTLANAFLRPVRGDDVLDAAWRALLDHVAETDAVYPFEQQRALIGPRVPPEARARIGAGEDVTSLPQLSSWVARAVGGA